jgi:DNA ligase (NAD+)
MKNLENLKEQIIKANEAYRLGEYIMTDSQYDAVLDELKEKISIEEFNIFSETLHEKSGKVKHPFVMGSLNKLKTSEPDTIKKFFDKRIKNKLNISAKVDGISCRLRYSKDGKLISASTRGDGYQGESLTDKIIYVRGILETIDNTIIDNEVLDLRGELVILRDDFASMSGFANPRNACAGIMNRKEWNKEDVSKVTFIAYTILGNKYSKSEQFNILENLGFNVAWHLDQKYNSSDFSSLMDMLIEEANCIYDYEIDGLVVCDSEYKNESKYKPDDCVAIKTNTLDALTHVIDISFEGPQKNGAFIPVAILEPVELGGSVISRASCHNLEYIKEKNIKYGSLVKILKSGDIIPYIVEVVDNSKATEIEFPTECLCCGEKLILDDNGLNLCCPNKECKDQILQQLTLFIKKLDVKSASTATLKNFGLETFKSLIDFRPDKKYKSQVKLFDELNEKIFTKSRQELLAAMNFNGLAEKQVNKIVDFYGFENIESDSYIGYPDGIADLTLNKFREDVKKNLELVDLFINDPRYKAPIKKEKTISNGMSVCFTGKLYTMTRNEASELAIKCGFEVKNSVTKGLTYLVTNDTTSGSSKNKKAKELGTEIIDEETFIKLTSNNVESDIFEI